MQNKFDFTASIWNYWEDKKWKEAHFVDLVMLSCHWKIAGQILTRTKCIVWYPPSNLLQRDPKQPTHKPKRSNSKLVKDQWNVCHDSRMHANFLLASSFGKKRGTFLGRITFIFFACARSRYRVITGYYVTLKYQAKPRTIAWKVFPTLKWLDST